MKFLMHYKKKTITLDELQSSCQAIAYDIFRQWVRELEEQGVLDGVRCSGNDFGGLFRKYRIMTGPLFASVAATIQSDAASLRLSGQLDISWYYSQPLEIWQRDKDDIVKLNAFFCSGDIIKNASLQQRSYDIFGNEKLLTGKGHALLTHLHITEDNLGIAAEADPLMMAVNPTVRSAPTACHLIVENKATYYGLLPYLPKSGFTSLILGYGWKIVGNLKQLPMQCCLPESRHICWYFGDFDWEGLHIWHSLPCMEHIEIRLAVPFYKAFLAYEPSIGKANQKPDEAALHAFLSHFDEKYVACFRDSLEQHLYYPQETLLPTVLQACWKEINHEIGKFL
ncbi:MAG: hypothetical protein LKF74_03295 [Megasphaera sp.]|jgi:hypothetical protein|nr:hypothetical protein [Megasphaera sp.]MCH4217569.1 hypothetical protein [Megasphaera sp.]